MVKYQKAYHLGNLRAFDGWQERAKGDKQEWNDDTVVYVRDDFKVVDFDQVFEDEPKECVLDAVDEAWKEFCKNNLQFEIPEDLRYAYEQEAQA